MNNNLCCPKCGGPIFEPKLIEESWYPKGTLMCKRYGHWSGLAKECLTQEQFREKQQEVKPAISASNSAWW